MDTREIFLTLGAVILFSMTALYTNMAISDGSKAVVISQVTLSATEAGLSHIERLKSLKFDEAVANDPDKFLPEYFTLPASFGADASETFANFDDLDDFHNYTYSKDTDLAPFNITTRISYMDSLNVNSAVSFRTRYKRAEILVQTPFLADTLKMYQLFSRW